MKKYYYLSLIMLFILNNRGFSQYLHFDGKYTFSYSGEIQTIIAEKDSIQVTDSIYSPWILENYVTNDIDTNWYITASAEFISRSQADDWIVFGPVILYPCFHGSLTWKSKISNIAEKNGFEILVSYTGNDIYNDFQNEPFYIVDDLINDQDTVWNETWITLYDKIDYYQEFYLAFHHNSSAFGKLSLDDIRIECYCSAAEKISSKNQFSIFPNPVNDIIRIRSSNISHNISEIKIFDINGQLKYSSDNFDNNIETEINLNFINTGIYFIVITAYNGQIFRQKIMKL